MLRYDCATRERVENEAVDAFLAEIVEVCRRHRMSLSHEDGQGAFQVTKHNDHDEQWLLAADIDLAG